jgi:ABC-2 type transport system ATP-binding protein
MTAATTAAMITARAVTKHFGPRAALDGVSLEVASGARALLVGPNGAGKTTLLRILAGFIDADAGAATVGGVDVADHRAAAARTGYLPEGAPLPPEMRVRAYLAWRARLKGLARAGVEAAVAEAMAATDLAGVASQAMGTLSRGFRQRVGLADALVARPPVLILDEPTVGLDPVQVRELGAVLDRLSGDRTVLVSTHALADSVAGRADHIVVLVGGRVVAAGTAAAVCAAAGAPTLEAAVVALSTGAAAGAPS